MEYGFSRDAPNSAEKVPRPSQKHWVNPRLIVFEITSISPIFNSSTRQLVNSSTRQLVGAGLLRRTNICFHWCAVFFPCAAISKVAKVSRSRPLRRRLASLLAENLSFHLSHSNQHEKPYHSHPIRCHGTHRRGLVRHCNIHRGTFDCGKNYIS